jgi:pilus assembly protein TadC
MERVSAKALAYGGLFVFLASMTLTGTALLAMGALAGLRPVLGEIGAAVAVGALFAGAPGLVFLTSYGRAERKPPISEEVSAALRPVAAQSSIGVVARTAFLGLAARRPLAALGLATLVSVARSSLVDRRPVQPAE